MLKIRLNQCTGKITYKVPRSCVCVAPLPVFILKVRRKGSCEYLHHFMHDELDGDLVSFMLDDEIRKLAEGYWQADLFAGCDWIGESTLIKERPSVTAMTKTDIIVSCDDFCSPNTPPCCDEPLPSCVEKVATCHES